MDEIDKTLEKLEIERQAILARRIERRKGLESCPIVGQQIDD